MSEEPTPHQLGFTWALEHELHQIEYRIQAAKLLAPKWKGQGAQLGYGQIRAQEWLAKTIRQAMMREAPKGDE